VDHHCTTNLESTLGAPGHARAVVRTVLRDEGLDDFLDDALLLASELVTNAVVHADGPISMAIAVDGPLVRVEVSDHTLGTLSIDDSTPETSGRGLRLLDALAARWGSDATPDGKIVWFELRARPGGAP
jgi:anti-sigma regulatory factor (Ser/Thr protein kinase)